MISGERRSDGSEPTEEELAHAGSILRRLKQRYRNIHTALRYRDPWQLLVATVLSAQTTDENVNRVTPPLFSRFPTARDLAAADPTEVEQLIYSTGYYKQKTKSIIGLSADLVEDYGGKVPGDLDELVTLTGVGRKTASVVLAEAFGKPAIAVDTHVNRVANRLGLTRQRDPVKVEQDLKALFPVREWAGLSMRIIQYGREVCEARRPRCWACPLATLCPYPDKSPPPP